MSYLFIKNIRHLYLKIFLRYIDLYVIHKVSDAFRKYIWFPWSRKRIFRDNFENTATCKIQSEINEKKQLLSNIQIFLFVAMKMVGKTISFWKNTRKSKSEQYQKLYSCISSLYNETWQQTWLYHCYDCYYNNHKLKSWWLYDELCSRNYVIHSVLYIYIIWDDCYNFPKEVEKKLRYAIKAFVDSANLYFILDFFSFYLYICLDLFHFL